MAEGLPVSRYSGMICDSGAVGAVTKGGERSERGEFLRERGGVSEGVWSSPLSAGFHRAQRARAWRRPPVDPPATGRGDSPLVHPQRATV